MLVAVAEWCFRERKLAKPKRSQVCPLAWAVLELLGRGRGALHSGSICALHPGSSPGFDSWYLQEFFILEVPDIYRQPCLELRGQRLNNVDGTHLGLQASSTKAIISSGTNLSYATLGQDNAWARDHRSTPGAAGMGQTLVIT